MIKDPIFTADQVNFLSGDLLLIFTDGLSELRNREDEEYGKERIISLLQDHHSESASGFIEALKDDVKKFSSNKFTDDITVMVIKRN